MGEKFFNLDMDGDIRLLPQIVDHVPICYNPEVSDEVTALGHDTIQKMLDELIATSGIPRKYLTIDSVPEDICEDIIFE